LDDSKEKALLNNLYKEANHLAARIQAMRNSLAEGVEEERIDYLIDDD
jgi:hypothetical protein